MGIKFISAAAAAMCIIAAPAAMAAEFAPWNPLCQGSGSRVAPGLSPGVSFSPKALDAAGVMTPDIVDEVAYHRVTNTAGVIDGPDGKDWFYTLELDGDLTVNNPYYQEYDYRSFNVKVYDEHHDFVGQAGAVIERPEDALKCQSIYVGTFVSKSFYDVNNTTYEIQMIANFNPGPDADGNARYGAKQFTQAYSLTDEVPEGGSACITRVPGYVLSYVNYGNSVSENIVLLMAEETSWDGEDTNTANYVIYKKAEWGTTASEVTRFVVDLSKSMSDGLNESTPCVVSAVGSDVYVATSAYEKTFLSDPTADDLEMNADNTFIISLYKYSGSKCELVKETRIPCAAPEGEDFLFRSYALGNFSGQADITFDFGNGSDPCYIITVVDSGTGDDSSAYYAVYDLDGNQLHTFGEASDSFIELWSLDGVSEQYGFNKYASDGNYGIVLMDYPSLQEVGFIPVLFENDGEIWSAVSSPDRTLTDDGVLYAMSVTPTDASTTGTADYVAWFRPDGSLHHVDRLDFGADAAKVLTNINGSVLNPYLFNTDTNFEYLAWVYRYINGGVGTTLELSVCDGNGNVLATRDLGSSSEFAGPFCYVANTQGDASIMVTYRRLTGENNEWVVYNEFISLPLNKFEGEGNAESPYIIRTYGDLDQVRNNLTSCFRLANDIDCAGRAFRPVEGSFTGSLDGDGHVVSNLRLSTDVSGTGFFKSFGESVSYGQEPRMAALRNVTFADPVLEYTGNLLGQKVLGIVAANAYNGVMENVFVTNPVFTLTDCNTKFGVLAAYADAVEFSACGVMDAEIDITKGNTVGGLVGEARGDVFRACYFSGVINANTNVGGIVGNAYVTPSELSDCHVVADIKGGTGVGGVLGHSNRSVVLSSIVEGTLEGSANIGGVAGTLDFNEDMSETIVIDNCVVALSDIVTNARAGAHRIVGHSAIDDGDRYIYDEDGNPTLVKAAHEAYLGSNYVVGGLEAFQVPEDGPLATEGAEAEGGLAFFSGIGYKFGNGVDAPWMMTNSSDVLPVLFFEPGSTSGVNAVKISSPLTYSGRIVYAPGAEISVYDINGRMVAGGLDALSTADLASGVYVVRASGGAVLKIAVR